MDAIYTELQIPAEVADDAAAEEAVKACRERLLDLAVDHQRSTFRRLVPRLGGALQRELSAVAMLFFDCVRADIQTTKAELGGVWKARRPCGGSLRDCTDARLTSACAAHARAGHRGGQAMQRSAGGVRCCVEEPPDQVCG